MNNSYKKIDSTSNRIKKALDLRQMKQVDLSEKTGIPKSRISCYISGKYEPKQDALYDLGKALNVAEMWLAGYDIPMERKWNDEQIDAASEIINDKNAYSDQVEADLKELYLEFGELSFNPMEIKMIREYARSMKENDSTYAYVIKIAKDILALKLNEEELTEVLKYAEYLRSRRN